MGGWRRRCWSRSRLRRLMDGLWCRDALLSCCRRRLCRVRRSLPRRWQTGEVGRARRMSCRCRRRRWPRRVCCRRLRRRLPSLYPCRGSRWRRSARAELHWLRRRLRRRMRPDPRGGQMREIRYTRKMDGYWCWRGRTGGGLRSRSCQRRRLASSCGGLLRSWRCCWRFLRGLRHEVDARRRSECGEIWPGRRTRRSRGYRFGLSGGRGCRQHRRHGATGSGRPYTPRRRRCRC